MLAAGSPESPLAAAAAVLRHAPRPGSPAPLLYAPIAVLVAVRGDTRDTSTYIDIFEQSTDFPWDPVARYADSGMEWAFGLASWLLNALGVGPTGLFFVVSLATFYFINKAASHVGLSLLEVLPYYMGSFFLLQQLMQIRQGVGAAFVLSVVTLMARAPRPLWRFGLDSLLAVMLHVTSFLPLIVARLLRQWMPSPTRFRLLLWAVALIAATALAARFFMSFDVIASLGRLSIYAAEDEYNSERGLLASANLRAGLLLFLFLFAAPTSLLRSRVYVLLLGLYAVHLGIRLGFFDFLILSARLSTALGVVEILLLPMLVKASVRSAPLRAALALGYLVVHLAATLTIQAPYLIDDYFTPLHPARSST